MVLHSHREGVSHRGIARLTGLAYNTVVSIIREASQRGQLLHNQEVKAVDTAEVSSVEMWSLKIERVNGILRQQTGRFHHKQNKFAKRWEWTEIIVRLLVSFYNWIWVSSRHKTTAAQRANLTDRKWNWHGVCIYPTLI